MSIENSSINIIGFKEFIKRDYKRLIICFLISLALTVILMSTQISTIFSMYGFAKPILWYDVIFCFITVMLPLLIIVFALSYFKIPFSAKTEPDRQKRLINILRLVIAIYVFYRIMLFGHQYMMDTLYDYMMYTLGAYLQYIISLIAAAAIIIDYRKASIWRKSVNQTYPWLLPMAAIILSSIACFVIVELLCGSKTLVGHQMLYYNIAYWLVAEIILYILFRHIKAAVIPCVVLAFLIGLANYCVKAFRGNYITAGDFTMIKTALEVADNYKLAFDGFFYAAAVITIITVILVCLIKIRQTQSRGKKGWLITIVLEIIIVALLIAGFQTGLLYKRIDTVTWNYNQCISYVGYLPFIMSNLNTNNDIEIKDHDPQIAATALEEADREMSDSATVASPNIIVIINEAFSDLAVDADFETNEDYMPFFRSLSENTIKGYVNLSVCGGPTGNTEFEFFTRSSMAYMPYGSIPFTQYIRSDVPSFVTDLKSQPDPYLTISFHCYNRTGYNRINVYPELGFDESYFVDDNAGLDLVRGYVSDKQDYQMLINLYENNNTDQPLFIYNLTMQNHGGYTENTYNFDNPIYITSFDADDSLNTYLSLIKESDLALEQLISYFSKVDEPTIILMFGDHQPYLEDEVWQQLTGVNNENASDEQMLKRYLTPFIIWANYDIDQENVGTISANYLSSYLMQTAGLELSAYDKYLLQLKKDFPSITIFGYWDAENSFHTQVGQNQYTGQLKIYENIQYNLLFDKKDKLNQYFNN